MTVSELYDYIDSFAPFDSCAEWDNSGLLAGDGNARVSGVVACLDVTEDEIVLAKENGANVIISHHPVIFRPVKNVLRGNPLYTAVSSGINIISAHTNLDKAKGGVNDILCETLGMKYEKCAPGIAEGFLNTGTIYGKFTPEDFASYISGRLNADVRFVSACGRIEKIAVCSGSGADFISEASTLGCNAFVTGDASYHAFLDAAALGISLFAAGHYETENLISTALAERIRSAFPGLKVFVSERKNPIAKVGNAEDGIKNYQLFDMN